MCGFWLCSASLSALIYRSSGLCAVPVCETETKHRHFKKYMKLLLSQVSIVISPLEDSNLQERHPLRTQMFGPNTFISHEDSGYSDR